MQQLMPVHNQTKRVLRPDMRLKSMAAEAQNALFGVISTTANPLPRCAALMENSVIDLSKFWRLRGHAFGEIPAEVDIAGIFQNSSLNAFAELPPSIRKIVRCRIEKEFQNGSVNQCCLIPLVEVNIYLPMTVKNYVDYFSSLEHAQNCAALLGGDVPPNFFASPLCYNGRASSIVPSATPIHRPCGIATHDASTIKFGPSKKLDFELELGFFLSKPVDMGNTISIEEAPDYIFGFVLLNDWSSRDLQEFEMRPLGPFHSKAFATSISPWIVPLDALEPFSTGPRHSHQQETLDHLRWKDERTSTFDIHLQAAIIRNGRSHVVAQSNVRDLYWTPFQQLTHLASSGCGITSGDLVGTGTISGSLQGSQGCLFEATANGEKAIALGDEEPLFYLEDDDEIVLDGWCCNAKGQVGLRFAECRGRIMPSTLL